MCNHGLSQTNIYKRWADMKSRCYNKKCCNYKYYGKRGIKICDEWLDEKNGFVNFYNWSIQNGYEKNLSIDRTNNNGDYSPQNCRWVTKSIQNMSMRHKNTSGYIGVCKHATANRWYGRVKVDNKCYYTGMSENIHEAAKMRNNYIISNGLDNVINKIEESVNEI